MKVDSGGEDGFFIDYDIIGVADGVSQWMIEYGIDAGIFAKHLC